MKLTPLLILVALLMGCNPGTAFDAACIKGRLSPKQAAAINELDWNHKPSYCQPKGRSHCEAEAEDRVLNSACSEFFKRLSG